MTSPLRDDNPQPIPAEPDAEQCPETRDGAQCLMAKDHVLMATAGITWSGDRDDIARAKRKMSPHVATVDGETVMW